MSNKERKLKIMTIFKECIPLFSVLSDEKRQEIVIILSETPEGLNVNAITEKIELSRPAVSHHLKILKQAGIVEVMRKGIENYYFLILKESVENLKKLIMTVEENCELK
ncbi:helix-turn-helix transcriptional regulator [Clostridium sp. CF012]|uniref:ArsR/SmtB family transcription factor n=1 Tax=Clostridium sp. CF012 TaxID=2843319 RepID=UPI00209B7D31|nr:metalloregulator ArsR/SmtB family transcription factor [Clostridium sp. CF012]